MTEITDRNILNQDNSFSKINSSNLSSDSLSSSSSSSESLSSSSISKKSNNEFKKHYLIKILEIIMKK